MTQHDKRQRFWQSLIYLEVAALIVLMIVTAAIRINILREDAPIPDDARRDPQIVLERANDSVAAAELILGFLEGASVLVVLGLGAAAIFGFRNSQDVRKDLQEEVARLKDQREEIRNRLEKSEDRVERLLEQVSENMPAISKVPTALDQIEELTERVDKTLAAIQPSFGALLQASQELNLRNYDESYRYICEVLQHTPENPTALYMAGWLELQYIPDKLEVGLAHLTRATELEPHSPSIRAALAVGIRRKALITKNEHERKKLLQKAKGNLLEVLSEHHNLIDLNRESFWGPYAGTERDLGNLELAIKAYQDAVRVTPNSSYPLGNLATLFLLQAKSDASKADEALAFFQRTRQAATYEISFNPGDYFSTMDVAMSNAIMGRMEDDALAQSERWLDDALGLDPTAGMLNVSLGGWRRLQQHCPDDWTDIHAHLETCIARIVKEIEARKDDGGYTDYVAMSADSP